MVRNGLKFVDAIKNYTGNSPMTNISRIEIVNRGDTSDLMRRKIPEFYECDIPAYVWMDIDRRHFIVYRSSLSEGISHCRVRMININK